MDEHKNLTSGNYPALLKINQVTSETNLSRSTIYELIRAGKLEHVKIGKSVRVLGASLSRFIESLRETSIGGGY